MSNILKRLTQRITPPARGKREIDNPDTVNRDILAVTLTGEPLQLARVHCNVFDQKGIVRTFEKMKCMDYDDEKQRWVWQYDNEAKGMKFKTRRKDLPRNIGSIVLGSFYFPDAERLYLDVNSFDRVIAAIEFFDRYLSRDHALFSHVQIVNRCFHATRDMALPTQKSFFDPLLPETPPDMDTMIDKISGDPSLTREEKLSLFQQRMQEDMRKPLPLTESLPIHFYTDGIEGLRSTLSIRGIVAMKNWAGDESFTFADLFASRYNS